MPRSNPARITIYPKEAAAVHRLLNAVLASEDLTDPGRDDLYRFYGRLGGTDQDHSAYERTEVESDTIRLTLAEFDALLDYSSSIPTGTTIGKRWKRRKVYHDESRGWVVGEFVEHPDPDVVGIKWWHNIEITDRPNDG